jgi:hypothetical protein
MCRTFVFLLHELGQVIDYGLFYGRESEQNASEL